MGPQGVYLARSYECVSEIPTFTFKRCSSPVDMTSSRWITKVCISQIIYFHNLHMWEWIDWIIQSSQWVSGQKCQVALYQLSRFIYPWFNRSVKRKIDNIFHLHSIEKKKDWVQNQSMRYANFFKSVFLEFCYDIQLIVVNFQAILVWLFLSNINIAMEWSMVHRLSIRLGNPSVSIFSINFVFC